MERMDKLKTRREREREREREFLFPKDKSEYDARRCAAAIRASCLRVIINYRSCRSSLAAAFRWPNYSLSFFRAGEYAAINVFKNGEIIIDVKNSKFTRFSARIVRHNCEKRRGIGYY